MIPAISMDSWNDTIESHSWILWQGEVLRSKWHGIPKEVSPRYFDRLTCAFYASDESETL